MPNLIQTLSTGFSSGLHYVLIQVMFQHDIRLHSKTVPVKRNVLFIHNILLRQDTSYSSVILICFCPLSLGGTSGCSHLHHNWTASTAKREQKKGPHYNTLALVSSGSAVKWNKMLTTSPFTPSSIATQLNKHHPTHWWHNYCTNLRFTATKKCDVRQLSPQVELC